MLDWNMRSVSASGRMSSSASRSERLARHIGQATTSIVVVDVPDRAPVVTAPADVRVAKNSAVTVNVTAIDPIGL